MKIGYIRFKNDQLKLVIRLLNICKIIFVCLDIKD